jgi:hypothetical protein
LTGGSKAGGTEVTITGSAFTGATAVNFGTVAGAFTFVTDGILVATAPSQAAGTVDITVVTPRRGFRHISVAWGGAAGLHLCFTERSPKRSGKLLLEFGGICA